jgi:NADPH:quinone reductase-like Zn-dependent oxidoreductase
MKAAYINAYGGPEQIKYGELSDPRPGKGEVLISVAAVSVNPVDWKIREGRLRLFSGKKFPMVLGTEVAGRVESTGKGVTSLVEGDRVFAGLSHKGGGYAEKACADQGKVIRIPDALSFEAACTLAVAGLTPMQAFTLHYPVKPGDEVLVNGGSGGVGTYAIQIAKILGARVTAVCSARNVALVKELGADEVIDYNEEDFRERKAAFDVILDAAANTFFPEAKGCLRKGGMLIKLNLSVTSFIRGKWSVLFSSKKYRMILVKNRPGDLQWMIDQIIAGKIRVVIDRVYPLEEARKAQEYSQSGRAQGKIVLQPGSRK